MELFHTANRCPQCGGDARSRYHGSGFGCFLDDGPHLHHRCEDCGFSWEGSPVVGGSAPALADMVPTSV
jgi:hypothetical protein